MGEKEPKEAVEATQELPETKKQKKPKKEKKKKGKKQRSEVTVGLHRKRVYLLWGIFIAAFVFAIYKNFTAIDRITTVETQTVKEKVVNTQPMEEYAKAFLDVYFSWDGESVSDRAELLEEYLDDELLMYAKNMLPAKPENESSVYRNEVWEVEKETDNEYRVVIRLGQKITEDKSTKYLDHAYETWVYVDDAGDMLITKLPTAAQLPEKTEDAMKRIAEADHLDRELKDEIGEFLEDFFKVYPTSSEKELKYYANEGVMPIIEDGSLELLGIDEVIVTAAEDDSAEVSVTVTYDQAATDTSQTFQYQLALKKMDTWKITEMK